MRIGRQHTERTMTKKAAWRIFIMLIAAMLLLSAGRLLYLAFTIDETDLKRRVVEAVRQHELLAWLDSPWVNARWSDFRVGPIAVFPKTPREEILEQLKQAFGSAPDGCKNAPLNLEVMEEEEFEDHLRRKIAYHSCGVTIPAYLLIPKGFDGPRPAAVVMHASFPEGKDHLVIQSSTRRVTLGLELVRRGFVVIAPDSLGFGERSGEKAGSEFYRTHPRWSVAGRMVFDHQRAVDVLVSLPTVAPNKIVAVGHSLGGHNALFLAAFDVRIEATVASCSYERIETDPLRDRWTRSFGYFPVERWQTVSWDFDDVYAAIAPRAVFSVTALMDGNFTHPYTAGQIYEAVKGLFPEDRLQSRFFLGGHGFPPHLQSQAWSWLQHQLG